MPESIPVLGISLILAVIAGKTAHLLRIPQVTGYILVGVVLGPTVLNILSTKVADSFHLINELAFDLILFNIGGEFHRKLLRRVGWKHIKFSALLSVGLFLLTFSICFVFSLLSSLGWTDRLVFAAFLGIVSIAAAPPTTLLVIKEFDAKGPLTQAIVVFLAVGTIISITGAQGATLFFQKLGVWAGPSLSYTKQVGLLLWSIFGSCFIGTILGLVLSYWEQKERSESALLVAVGCTLLLGQTLAYYLRLEPLLLSLFVGFALVNSSPAGKAIHSKIKGLGLSIYALFFVLAGAHLHIQKQLATIGLLGLGYIVARTLAAVIAARIAAKVSEESKKIEKYMGASILSHAGAALAIVGSISTQLEPSAQTIVTVVMSSIFFFEILGPLSLKFALKAAEEVKPIDNLERVISRASLPARNLVQNFVHNVGLLTPKHAVANNVISPLIDRDIVAIEEGARIRELIHFLENYTLSVYPIVNKSYQYLGIVDLGLFHRYAVQHQHQSPVSAKLVLQKYPTLNEEATIQTAINRFLKNDLKSLPVVNETGRLVGILRYKSLIVAMNAKPTGEDEKSKRQRHKHSVAS